MLKIRRLGVQALVGLARKKILLLFHFLDDKYCLGQKDLDQQASLNAPACVFLLLSYKLSQTFSLEYFRINFCNFFIFWMTSTF